MILAQFQRVIHTLFKQVTSHRLLRYLIVGCTANGLGLAIFHGLTLTGVWPELASLVAFFPAFTVAYLLNRNWSFQSNIGHGAGLIRYASVTFATFLFQVSILALLYRLLGITPLLAQILAIIVTIPLSYLLLKLCFNTQRKGNA